MGLDQDSGMSFVRFENRLPAQNKVKWNTKGCRWRLKGKIPILDVCENKKNKSGLYITAGRKYVAKIAKDDIMPLMIIYVSAIYRPWSHLSLSSILVFGDKWTVGTGVRSSPPKKTNGVLQIRDGMNAECVLCIKADRWSSPSAFSLMCRAFMWHSRALSISPLDSYALPMLL